MESNILNKILGIVVIYNKELTESDTLMSLQADVIRNKTKLDVFIYDNSPNVHKPLDLEGINIVEYIHDKSNAGVSLAYNEGVKYAKEIGKEWVLLLDQDTAFKQGILNAYLESVLSHPEIKLFCPIIRLENSTIFSPFRKVFKRGYALKKVKPITYALEHFSPVNSGVLVNVASYNEAGGYNENVKLDFSDLQFIERFSVKNRLFKVVNGYAKQDFSNEINDINVLNKRFIFFCQGAKNCDKKNLLEKFQYLVVVVIRATMLSIRTKSAIFYKTFYQEYL